MTYKETIEYLYNATPQFERIGAAAYKPGLDTARRLDNAFGNPHRRYPTIHVAGTNGKGSTCHTLAAILQSQGYRTGLYTSPHLRDFRERMRVDGEMISEQEVIDFVERYRSMGLDVTPSFFELTTIMAFDYFARRGVDVAVIETGLGGRLDTTNIITPALSIITNISLDHTAQLVDTPAQIAGEKAGIIKRGIPAVIGNS
ncbi:MAG: bifunctional folylpolyglutamate synthase/dihydrofolate synthase, partial [Muribaculaceae bacterium]|nr:bifunctional folylpolyglutamate synthase/dihydrofolate synthase [Muribaculaceae bacterium]